MAAPMKTLWISRIKTLKSLLDALKGMGFSFARYISTKQSIARILEKSNNNDKVTVKGWVKSLREHREVVFLNVSDGSCVKPVQVVATPGLCSRDLTFGSCVSVEGSLIESSHPGQSVELSAQRIEVIGHCDPVQYPFKARKKHPSDYVRTYPHLRPKTNIFSSLLRIRNAATMAFHGFFQEDGFCFIHTPILTSHDCEGAGEVFQIKGSDSADGGFFGRPTYLNVSGQLHLEVMTGGMAKVYNFGPTFRAENSQGRHHLAEFNMIEAELAFVESLDEIIQVMEEMVKRTTQTVLDTVEDDVDFYTQNIEGNGKRELLAKMLSANFEKLTYTEAITLLERHNSNFQFQVKWGCDLQKEHERWLTQHFGNVPVFVTDFPVQLKPFYAKINTDQATVSAVDLLVPGVGELIGGSVREDCHDILQSRLSALDKQEEYQWYLDLRQFGSAPHGGFGLGFERYLQFLLGTSNIRDVIPFPRSPKNCKL